MEHIRAIYRLLFDVAAGRRILEQDTPSLPGAFDDVRQKVYALGETLRNLVIRSGMVPPYASCEQVITYVFVLDAHHRIVDLNVKLAERLGYSPEALRYRPFESLLASDTLLAWRRCVTSEDSKTPLFWVVDFVFLAENGAKLPLLCTVCDALYNDWVFVLSVEFHLEFLTPMAEVGASFKNDVALFEEVHAYVLAHLDDALPSLRTLSSRLGIGEHKLHKGFKHFYGKSIYQFYQEERLKLGHHLIVTTRLQLKEIAYRCGFSSYINFYKAFKKAHGIAPSALLRP